MAANGMTNGVTGQSRVLAPGIFAPIPSFFLPESEDLDIPTFQAHVVKLATAGVYPVISGSMSEAVHLSHSERIQLIHAARNALDNAGLTAVPTIVGTGAPSTRESIQLTRDAAHAGADFAIVICNGYYAGVLASDRQALLDYWKDVAAASPIPVMIYNFPGASGGIDLDSDLVTQIAQECPNICGVKLTCGNVGKLTRIADAVSPAAEFNTKYPRKNPKAPFLVLGGFTDFITPSTFVNGHGAITGLANLSPHATVKLFKLSEQSAKDLSFLPEAQRLQGIIARADFTIAKTHIAGTKLLLQQMYGYGGLTRKPLPPLEPAAAQALWEHPHVQDLVKLERECSGKLQ